MICRCAGLSTRAASETGGGAGANPTVLGGALCGARAVATVVWLVTVRVRLVWLRGAGGIASPTVPAPTVLVAEVVTVWRRVSTGAAGSTYCGPSAAPLSGA